MGRKSTLASAAKLTRAGANFEVPKRKKERFPEYTAEERAYRLATIGLKEVTLQSPVAFFEGLRRASTPPMLGSKRLEALAELRDMAEYCNDPKRAESYGLGDPVEKEPAGEGGVVMDDHDLGGKATIFKPGKSKILPA